VDDFARTIRSHKMENKHHAIILPTQRKTLWRLLSSDSSNCCQRRYWRLHFPFSQWIASNQEIKNDQFWIHISKSSSKQAKPS
jgi:hypothetical protein